MRFKQSLIRSDKVWTERRIRMYQITEEYIFYEIRLIGVNKNHEFIGLEETLEEAEYRANIARNKYIYSKGTKITRYRMTKEGVKAEATRFCLKE